MAPLCPEYLCGFILQPWQWQDPRTWRHLLTFCTRLRDSATLTEWLQTAALRRFYTQLIFSTEFYILCRCKYIYIFYYKSYFILKGSTWQKFFTMVSLCQLSRALSGKIEKLNIISKSNSKNVHLYKLNLLVDSLLLKSSIQAKLWKKATERWIYSGQKSIYTYL